jgi:hypothetical protein
MTIRKEGLIQLKELAHELLMSKVFTKISMLTTVFVASFPPALSDPAHMKSLVRERPGRTYHVR